MSPLLDLQSLELVRVEELASPMVANAAWTCPTCGERRDLGGSATVRVRNRTGPPLERRIQVCEVCRPALEAAPDRDTVLDDTDRATLRGLLEQLSPLLGPEVAFISCIQGSRFHIAAARDDQSMGFQEGMDLHLRDTFCIRHVAGAEAMTGDARDHPAYAEAPARNRFDIRSYATAPIVLDDGTMWGTMCALDRAPHRVEERDLQVLRVGAAFVAAWVDERQRRDQDERGRSSTGVDAEAVTEVRLLDLQRFVTSTTELVRAMDPNADIVVPALPGGFATVPIRVAGPALVEVLLHAAAGSSTVEVTAEADEDVLRILVTAAGETGSAAPDRIERLLRTVGATVALHEGDGVTTWVLELPTGIDRGLSTARSSG